MVGGCVSRPEPSIADLKGVRLCGSGKRNGPKKGAGCENLDRAMPGSDAIGRELQRSQVLTFNVEAPLAFVRETLRMKA